MNHQYLVCPIGKPVILCNSDEEFRKIAIEMDHYPCQVFDFIGSENEMRRLDFDVWHHAGCEGWVDVTDRYGMVLCTLKPPKGDEA